MLVFDKILTYVLVGLGGAAGAATLYRYAPNHPEARWVWLTPGSALAAILWLLLTLGFGIYVADFGNYNATYGSLGAVAVTLTWLYLSGYVLLLGAELNSELDHEANPEKATSSAPTLSDKAPDTSSNPAPVARPPAASTRQDLAMWRAGRRARQAVGREEVSLAPSLLATGGLALLRRRDRATAGFALLAAGGLIAFITADPEPQSSKPRKLP